MRYNEGWRIHLGEHKVIAKIKVLTPDGVWRKFTEKNISRLELVEEGKGKLVIKRE